MIEKSARACTSAERLAFEIYVRTGNHVSPDTIAEEIETKFNPWHDTDDGRFTFSGQGQYSPKGHDGRSHEKRTIFRGGGGRFGGGGATGSWDPDPKSPPATTHNPKSLPSLHVHERTPTKISSPRNLPAHEPPKTVIPGSTAKQPLYRHEKRNGYGYDIDAKDRTHHVQGEVRLITAERRSHRLQREAGKPDRLPTDDGGHYIAGRFGGPREAFNHFAQDASVNRGTYRLIEQSWANEIESGRRVFVDIVPHYRGESRRPYSLTVRWSVDGEPHKEEIPNEKRGK